MKLDIEREVAALQRLSTGQLCERYAELFGEPTRSRHRTYLIRKIAWQLQALVEGGLSERARRRAAELARGTELRVMPPKAPEPQPSTERAISVAVATDPRLPAPGTAMVRQYKGRTLRVLVLPDGFEFEGQRYKSLSAVAKKITGSHVNGYRFFGLEGKA
ncbi:MAG: hypothetical protein KatS3mg082_2905 [Nitrospiraceae bacterium]|nr:MAG: hypothetical protein KatS3mg082_2679 [Nitrospiraceae bacterium]GIW56336.1 MAG: hypothetical protein KatS3mg082_2740 [Nitrospiraceae bacterium]GIW56501.1 MAG: hypothetical protein KatS3mg082_2905 [Nitrospiraceae bacterium]